MRFLFAQHAHIGKIDRSNMLVTAYFIRSYANNLRVCIQVPVRPASNRFSITDRPYPHPYTYLLLWRRACIVAGVYNQRFYAIDSIELLHCLCVCVCMFVAHYQVAVAHCGDCHRNAQWWRSLDWRLILQHAFFGVSYRYRGANRFYTLTSIIIIIQHMYWDYRL